MAIINYTMGVTPVGTANTEITLFAVIPSATLPPTIGTPITGTNTLTLDNGIYYLSASSQVLSAININNPTSTWTDAVYKLEIATYIDDNLDDITFTDVYFLKTFNIDAGIAAYPLTTPLEIAVKALLVSTRTSIDANFAATNYSNCNDDIQLITSILAAPTNIVDLVYAISLTAPAVIEIDVDPTSPWSNSFITHANVLTNTLDGEVIDFSVAFPFLASTGTNQTYNIPSAGTYSARFADGVYSSTIGALDQVDPITSGDLYQGDILYLLVTTETDLGIILYGLYHDTSNPAQVATYAQLLVLQALVLSEYAANDYAGANQAIEDIFALLGTGIIWTDFGASLTDESNITLTFTSLPSGTYSGGAGTLTNTMTLEEYGYTGFPVNSADVTEVLNSVTLDAGDDYTDGVYQVAGSFTVDGVLFTYSAYVLVITDIYCGYDKIVAKAATCKFSASLQMKIQAEINMIINCFQRGDYVTANNHIRIATQMLSQSGCGCGCG